MAVGVAKPMFHVHIFRSTGNLPRDEAPHHHAQSKIKRNMAATIETTHGIVQRDLSQISERSEVVKDLETTGWVIIKGGASDRPEEATSNRDVVAIVAHMNKGHRFMTPKIFTRQSCEDQPYLNQQRRWWQIPSNKRTASFAVFHLTSTSNTKWSWSYMEEMREGQSEKKEVCPAAGDLLICSSLLSRLGTPVPKEDSRLIFLNYVS
ncbi:hypothetical protein AJ80_07702 [Polytolypa hystricis UAMH7299]|uniref:Uncharacterized protein n=1 Tax=Polytolypa hystricis (strain UAMH7299) TaxID=1447883 RepID=A0A2B7XJT6_POLH7|nr:hypothetical protein AJ80_07702 [Polytolypa hystricis UAMH7299]